MSLFSSLFKTKKQNLTPDIAQPTQEQLYFTPTLRDFVDKRLRGEGLGFGDEYVNKATNPVAESMRRNFRNETAPTISSEQSKRGLGRSSLAVNQIGKAEGDVESGIGNLMAQFYQLNEAQKKNDTTEALNVANNMQGQQASMKTNEANASERLNARTAENSQYRENRDAGLAGNMLQAGAQLLVPGANAMSSIFSGMNLPGLSTAFSNIGKGAQDFNATKAQVLGGDTRAALLKALLES